MQLGSGLQGVAVGGVCQLLELRCCRWLLQLAGKLLQTIGGDAEREGEAGRGRAAVAVGVGGGMLCLLTYLLTYREADSEPARLIHALRRRKTEQS